MIGGTQLLARGRSFALFRTPLGHIAVVGQLRDGLDIELSMAHVDFAPVKSPCLFVDCSNADHEARNAAVTVMDWVLNRASLEASAEVWLVPDYGRERRGSARLAERAMTRTLAIAPTEAEAIGAIMKVREDAIGSDVGIRWSALLHAARTEAAKAVSQSTLPAVAKGLDELLMRAALREIRESIMVTDADLAEPGPRILYVNRAFTEITGYKPEDVIGKSPRILHGRRTDKNVLGNMRAALESGAVVENETFNYRKDGTEFSMQWTVHPLRDDKGRIVRYFAIQRDTTEARRYEAIARAVNMTDNIGMIFSGIRHELGNPVNSIKTALSVLRKQHRAFGPDKTDSYLERIMDEVTRVEFLLSSLRSFTAFEQAKTDEIDLRAFLRDFARLVRSDLEAHAVAFEILEIERVPNVRVDPRALNQVLLNLVHNACDALAYTDSKRLDLIVSTKGTHVQLVVRDNGCGMAKSQLDRLFVPFHTTKERGTGLGLVIAQKLVTEMGGHLHVRSELKKGTDVTIELKRSPGGGRC